MRIRSVPRGLSCSLIGCVDAVLGEQNSLALLALLRITPSLYNGVSFRHHRQAGVVEHGLHLRSGPDGGPRSHCEALRSIAAVAAAHTAAAAR